MARVHPRALTIIQHRKKGKSFTSPDDSKYDDEITTDRSKPSFFEADSGISAFSDSIDRRSRRGFTFKAVQPRHVAEPLKLELIRKFVLFM